MKDTDVTASPDAGTCPARRHQGFAPRLLDSSDFDTQLYRREWLVEGVLVAGQAGVVGGPKKCLKTSLVVDLAVSLGSGTPFLGAFAVPHRRRGALFSGETGPATLQETARRVCAARGVALGGCDVLWGFDLPRLADPGQLAGLAATLKHEGAEMVVLDPLFACLGGGPAGVSASNLYEVGPLLWSVARACLGAGATPLLVHHATKSSARSRPAADAPLDLDDLAFAGVAEFARQWLLVRRRAPYAPGSGRHELRLEAGGSPGHSGGWDVDVDEGVVDRRFRGRAWGVTVGGAAPARPAAARRRGPAKA